MGDLRSGPIRRQASTIVACGTAIALAPVPAVASPPEQWSAVSTTAISITGDIALEENRLTFGNGVSVKLHAVGPDYPGIYTIDPPDPELLNGNRLCGPEALTFVGIVRDADSLYMKAFDSAEPRRLVIDPLPQAGVCATYNFARP